MNRFIALVWNERSDKAQAEAAHLARPLHSDFWTQVWEKAGVKVFEAPRQSAADDTVEAGDVFIMGAVFANDGRRLNGEDLNEMSLATSRARRLFADAWGRYVAFVRDGREACVYVARDPSGALPCFIGRRGSAFVFFSHPGDITLLDLDEKLTDWNYLARRLLNNRTQTTRTGLLGVQALGPGAIARVGQGRLSIRIGWSAADIADEAHEMPLGAAAQCLHDAVSVSCKAWAQRFERVGLRLSGGLDSSLVLGAIAPYAQIEALNFATKNAEGDERAFARQAACFARISLTERMRNPDAVDLAAAVEVLPSLNPHLWLADGETDAHEAAFARERGINAFFSGRGGDNVFFRSEKPHVLADWLSVHGFGPRFLQHAWNYASASGEPVISAAATAARLTKCVNGSASIASPIIASFLTRKCIELAGSDEPSFEALPPGKRLHIRSIGDRLNYFDYRSHADYLYPLVSQPVIEACLKLPTYVLSPTGADRALARRAFAQSIAPAILARQTKGRTNAYLARILIRHIVFLRRFLLDGELVSAGLVDRDGLCAILSEGAIVRSMDAMAQLVGLLGVEAWLRRRPAPALAAQSA